MYFCVFFVCFLCVFCVFFVCFLCVFCVFFVCFLCVFCIFLYVLILFIYKLFQNNFQKHTKTHKLHTLLRIFPTNFPKRKRVCNLCVFVCFLYVLFLFIYKLFQNKNKKQPNENQTDTHPFTHFPNNLPKC
jgi:TRAP-type C4-dicarboxylate transport system permease small subunit